MPTLPTKPLLAVGATAAIGAVLLSGCSTTSTPPSKTGSHDLTEGGTLFVKRDPTKYVASAGTMALNLEEGLMAGSVDVAATSTTQTPSAWNLHLVTNAGGIVQSGSLTSANGEFKVSEPSGKVNLVIEGASITLETTDHIKVQRKDEKPTTMSFRLSAT